MKLKDLVWGLKKRGLEVVSQTNYTSPVNVCSRWITVDGPAYPNNKFIGDFCVDVQKILDWAIGQAERTWTNQKNIELAKKYFPQWILNADLSNESLSLLDSYQLEFLRPHISTFIGMNCYKVYCPSCSKWFDEIASSGEKSSSIGKIIKWRDEYRCSNNHVLYSQEEEIRVF